MYEQDQDIKELESKDPVQSEDRKTVGNLMEDLSLIEKGSKVLVKRVLVFQQNQERKNYYSVEQQPQQRIKDYPILLNVRVLGTEVHEQMLQSGGQSDLKPQCLVPKQVEFSSIDPLKG
ncbi:hypothetical protein TNCV_1410031 [Trichonephila clavipes]|nr:hypothetical protein TNCV_1410031 [Trichonephila clavipes]